MEEKPFTLSLKTWSQKSEVERRGGGRSNSSRFHNTLIFSWSMEISFKDDVTVVILLGVSFTGDVIEHHIDATGFLFIAV
jgi:hypothetical protein